MEAPKSGGATSEGTATEATAFCSNFHVPCDQKPLRTLSVPYPIVCVGDSAVGMVRDGSGFLGKRVSEVCVAVSYLFLGLFSPSWSDGITGDDEFNEDGNVRW